MKACKCGKYIPATILIGGKRRNLKNRTQCLSCLPFGVSPFRVKTLDEIRSAKAIKAKKHYHKRKDKLGIDPIRFHREERKKEIINRIGGCCQLCGYNKAMRNLAFHHLSDKRFGLSSRGLQYSMEKIIAEAKKCIVVCHNCHGEIHDGMVDTASIIAANKIVNELL